MITVFIFEPDPMVSRILTEAVQARDGLEALKTVRDIKQLSHVFEELHPQLILGETSGTGLLDWILEQRVQGNPVDLLPVTRERDAAQYQKAFAMGIVDYVIKPFGVPELLARIRAMTRGSSVQSDAKLRFGNVVLDSASYELSGPAGNFRLANKEYQMLEMLMRQPNRLVSTERFMERIWGYDSESEVNVVWVYISYLRKKLAAVGANVRIKAQRNAGYCLEEGE